jgi:hypothetical protein
MNLRDSVIKIRDMMEREDDTDSLQSPIINEESTSSLAIPLPTDIINPFDPL